MPALARGDGSIVSICDRTLEVRLALRKQLEDLRFNEHQPAGEFRCNDVRSEDLEKIEILFLHQRGLRTLKPGDFAGLSRLVSLDLSGNQLEQVPLEIFEDLPALETLDLSRNPNAGVLFEPGDFPSIKNVIFSREWVQQKTPLETTNEEKFDWEKRDLQVRKRILQDYQDIHGVKCFFYSLVHKGKGCAPKSGLDADDLASLTRLDLSELDLESLKKADLMGLNQLELLDLHGSRFGEVDPHLLYGLPHLKFIRIDRDLARQPDMIQILQAAELSGVSILDGDTYLGVLGTEVAQQIDRLRLFVAKHSGLPLDVQVETVGASFIPVLDHLDVIQMRRSVIRQLSEVQDAYRYSAFDFFGVKIFFDANPRHSVREPKIKFDKKTQHLVIRLSGTKTASSKMILAALAEGFEWNRNYRWYEGEGFVENLVSAIQNDFNSIDQIESELRNNVVQLDRMNRSARARWERSDSDRPIFLATEQISARQIQFSTWMNLHKLINIMTRWRPAMMHSHFPFPREVRLIAAHAATVYQAYQSWFLDVVIGDGTFLYRSPLFVMLDTEPPVGLFDSKNLATVNMPSGSIRVMLTRALTGELSDWISYLAKLADDATADDFIPSVQKKARRAIRKIGEIKKIAQEHALPSAFATKNVIESWVKDLLRFPVYKIVAEIACVVGDTRVQDVEPAISKEMLQEMEAFLKPGDLLLERMDYFLSNAFLGGFFPHTIIYLGSVEQWGSMRLPNGTRLAEDPWIHDTILPNYRSRLDDKPARVLEAISEGVVFNSMEEAVRKDYIAIVRPIFPSGNTEANVATAIRTALQFFGRPYDFGFDFSTDELLVCSELAYRAYQPFVNFLVQSQAANPKPFPRVPGVVSVMGRDTMPSDEIARLALYMKDHPVADPAIGYPGRVLEIMRVYMKQENGIARVYEGEEAEKLLRKLLGI